MTKRKARTPRRAKPRTTPKSAPAPISYPPFNIFTTTDTQIDKTTHHGWHTFVVFLLTFVVYAFTMPTVITYEDEAIFNMLCYHHQPAHPPGYPLYSILCYPFTHIPFLSVVAAGNTLSATFGGLACAVLYLITVHLLGGSPYYGYLAGLGYGFSRLLWSQSIIQEVYTLHAFLILLVLLLTLIYARDRNPVILKWLALAYGLSIANHWPLTVLAVPAVLVLLVPVWKNMWKHISKARNFLKLLTIIIVSGPLLYLYIFISNLPSPITFYEPVQTWDRFVYYVARTAYSGVDNQMASWFDKVMYAKFLIQQIWSQFGIFLTPFIIGGFISQWKRWHWSVGASLTFTYVSTTFLLLLLVHFRYTDLFEGVFGVYQIVAYATFGIWTALAVKELFAFIRAKWVFRPTYMHAMQTAVVLVLVSTVASANWEYNNRAQDRLAYNHARTVLNSFEKDSIVITYGDFDMPILQQHVIEGVRKDITMYNGKGLFLSNRYYHKVVGDGPMQDKITALFVGSIEEDKPIYYFKEFNHKYGIEDFGLYRRVRKDWEAGRIESRFSPELMALWDDLDVDDEDLNFDVWVKQDLRWKLLKVLLESKDAYPEVKQKYYEKILNGSFHEILSFISYLVITGKQPDVVQFNLAELVQKAEQRAPDNIRPRDRAMLLHAKIIASNVGVMLQGHGLEMLIEQLQEALDAYPSSDNWVIGKLLRIYASTGRRKEFDALHNRYPSFGQDDRLIQFYANQNAP